MGNGFLTIYGLAIGIIVIVIVVITKTKKQKFPKDNYQQPTPAKTVVQPIYTKKKLLSKVEIDFYRAIREIVNGQYRVYPQINLATVIEKQGDFKYQNELYRNIDFAIFDTDFSPIVLIEINDNSHLQPERQKRDIKVRELCRQAGLPMITLWVDKGINKDYIKKRISEYCQIDKN